MSEKNSGEVMLSFLLGGLIGAALGLIFAPRSGKETRRRLVELSDDLGERLSTLSKEVSEKTEDIIAEGKDKLREEKGRLISAFEAGKKAFEKND